MRGVFVPRDACAIACGAEDVVRALAAAGIEAVRTSSRGLFWLEPLVEVEEDGVRWGFGPLDAPGAETLAAALAGGAPRMRALRAPQASVAGTSSRNSVLSPICTATGTPAR